MRKRRVKTRRGVSTLEKNGFYMESSKGSHRNYEHKDGRSTTVYFHGGSKIISPKNFSAILKDTGKSEDEF